MLESQIADAYNRIRRLRRQSNFLQQKKRKLQIRERTNVEEQELDDMLEQAGTESVTVSDETSGFVDSFSDDQFAQFFRGGSVVGETGESMSGSSRGP